MAGLVSVEWSDNTYTAPNTWTPSLPDDPCPTWFMPIPRPKLPTVLLPPPITSPSFHFNTPSVLRGLRMRKKNTVAKIKATVGPEDEPFIKAILDHPGDPSPLGVYGDWLDEQSRTDLGYAYHWAAARKRWPQLSKKKQRTSWTGPCRHGQPQSWQLPWVVHQQLRPRPAPLYSWGCLTVPDAFAGLAESLIALRGALSLSGPPTSGG
jgi:uncharacterized protein (TIGR02996 family)